MLNFELHNSTRIVFGKKTCAKFDTLLGPDARVLVLLGGESSTKNGMSDGFVLRRADARFTSSTDLSRTPAPKRR